MPQATAHVPGVRKLGVLRANSLGDYLFAVPALTALRAAYPDAEIVLLGAPWHARVLSGRPGPVDRVMVVPAAPGIRDPEPGESERGAQLLDALRRERFDLVVQLHGGGANSNPLVRQLDAKVSAGLRADGAPPLDRWLRYVYLQPEVFRYLEVVGLVGASPVTFTPQFALTPADEAELAALGEFSGPMVALHPGASDPRRRWPPDRFAAVGDALAEAGAQLVLTGIAAEADVVAAVRDQLRHPARSLVDAMSVGGLGALYARCGVVVANDTGPLHLAAAVGAPSVGIFWAANMINGAPVTRARHRAFASWQLRCPRCGSDGTAGIQPGRDGERCEHNDSFVVDIPAAAVIEAALDLRRGAPDVSPADRPDAPGSAR